MKPIRFDEANAVLQAPSGTYSSNVVDVDELPCWVDGQQYISCWRPSLRERLSVLLFGRIWLSVLSGWTQPPVALSACRTYFEPIDDLPETEL